MVLTPTDRRTGDDRVPGEALLTDPDQDPERSAQLADSVSMAALLLLEAQGRLAAAVPARA